MYCDEKIIKEEEILRNKTCVFLSGVGYNPEGVLVGSGVIIPFAHRATPFDLTEEEIADTFSLLSEVKAYLDDKYKPEGYTLGWNVGKVGGQNQFHSHLHVLPRYDDEPLATKGIRYFYKQRSNSRIKEVRES